MPPTAPQDLRVSCLNIEQTRHLQASLSRLQRVVQVTASAEACLHRICLLVTPGPNRSPSHPQHARAQRVRLLVDAEYTSLNPALSLLVAALATRWNSSREGGPWVWNTYQAYLKVCGALWGWGMCSGTRGCRPGSQCLDLKLPMCSIRTPMSG